MASKLKDSLARQLRLPTTGIMGWITLQILKSRNGYLEKNASRLSAIEPHHNVLEIGFGPGIGLKHALQYVKDGTGKLYGVDLSSYMAEKATARLSAPIRSKKVELAVGSVDFLPYGNDIFHRVFHCNCYYFWPSMQDALREICRVMKPGGMMVTVLNMQSLQASEEKGFLKYGNPDPFKYMCALELTGFHDVRIEYFTHGSLNYQAIFAHLPLKPTDQSDLSESGAGACVDVGAVAESREGAHSLQKDPSTSS